MLRFLARHRPPASMLVALVALFVALGGVGWAALQIPAHSVGNAQLKKGSVGAADIRKGAVGTAQINPTEVQDRIGGACVQAAIATISAKGTVTCSSTLPAEHGISSGAVPVGTTATTIVSQALPPGSALVIANQYLSIPGNASTAQRVPVSCTLLASGTALDVTRAIALAPSGDPQLAALPIVAEVTIGASGATATVSCTQAPTPATPSVAVTASSTINVLETQPPSAG
jgi:hypothetical protein